MSSITPIIARRRVGTEEKVPEQTLLTAGAMTADFVAGGLRTIRYQGREVLRSINYVVRDKDWGTDSPEIIDCTIQQDADGFAVAYRGRCARAETHEVLEYQARITGNKGRIIFDVTAEALTPFLTARCGFTILHPLDGVVGQPAIIEHVDGSEEHTTFPENIAPTQPFKEIRAIRHEVMRGVAACCRLDGDVFEMEDQRLWSDASYKTYVRPLALPWPYVLDRGVRNRQSVELQITDDRELSVAAKPAGREDATVTLEIGLPEQVFPEIGVAIYPEQISGVLAHPALLKRLRPQLLLLHFDPTAGHHREHMDGFAEIARGGADEPACVLELVVPGQRNVDDELREVAAMVSDASLKLSAVIVSPAADRQSTLPGSAWPPCPPLAEVYRAARAAFPGLAIGGGMLSYFAEFARKRPPVDLLDFVSHCTCPIVHAADDLSVMQTLEAMPYIVRSARAIIGQDKPYRIGPSTLGMRQNPYGSRVVDNPQNRRITMTSHDPRQTSLFAAAWMIGYAAATAEGRLQALTVGALTGPLGLATTSAAGAVSFHPAFYTARGLADLGGHPRFECYSSRPDSVVAVVGEGRDGERVAWLANLTGRTQTFVLAGAAQITTMEVWDEENFDQPLALSPPATAAKNSLPLQLRPYAVVCLKL
jgi:D-apionolactonase